jgi:hypothetical protein
MAARSASKQEALGTRLFPRIIQFSPGKRGSNVSRRAFGATACVIFCDCVEMTGDQPLVNFGCQFSDDAMTTQFFRHPQD